MKKILKNISAILGCITIGVLSFVLFLPYGIYIEYHVKFNPRQAWAFVASKAPIEYVINASETDQGATGNGRTIKAFVDAIGATRKATIKVLHTEITTSSTYTLTTSETIPSTVKLEMDYGAILDGAGTLTQNGPFEAGLGQCFGSSITVTFGSGAVKEVYPEWRTTNATPGTTDMTAAFQWAVTGANRKVRLSDSIYLITSTVLTSDDRVHIVGSGQHATKILFVPTANDICFEFKDSGNVLYQCSIKDLSFYSTDTTYQKIAIVGEDTGAFHVENIASYPWTGANSIGLQMKGREFFLGKNLYLYADTPIELSDNPNSTIDADHFHFEDTYLGANAQPCFLIDDGVNVTNLVVDGVNPWVEGTYGLYWADTTTEQASLSVNLKNIRTEQGTLATAYSIYISHNYNLQDLKIENCYLDSARKGVYLRKCFEVSNINLYYVSTTLEGYNADNTSNNILFTNCFFQAGSTASLSNLVEKWSWHKRASGSPIPENALYVVDPGAATQQPTKLFGVNEWAHTGTLADDAQLDIPAQGGNSRVAAMIFVAAYEATPTNEGGIVLDTANDAVLISGTANFGVGNVDGDLTIFHSGTHCYLYNRLGVTITYVIRVVYI